MNDLFAEFDKEMAARSLEAVVVTGETTLENPSLAYVVGASLPRGGIFIKKRHEQPTLVVSNIDVGSAKKGRVKIIKTYNDYGFEKLAAKYGRQRAVLFLLREILRSEKIRGPVAIAGSNDASRSVWVVDGLRRLGCKILGEAPPGIIEKLRETKTAEEIDKVRSVAKRTVEVVEETLSLLSNARIKNGKLWHGAHVLNVAKVKSMIASGLARRRLVAPEGTIFAPGPSSADPHNRGVDVAPVKSRQPIILDIFPRDETGYWFDITRTVVIGRAPRRIRKMYEATLDAQLTSLDVLRVGAAAENIMNVACDVLERHGFLTSRAALNGNKRALRLGFIHSLGHGVGLTIGERPYLSLGYKEKLKAGHVVTVEPGVYIPGLGGVRIEDTVILSKSGLDNPSRLSKELEY